MRIELIIVIILFSCTVALWYLGYYVAKKHINSEMEVDEFGYEPLEISHDEGIMHECLN